MATHLLLTGPPHCGTTFWSGLLDGCQIMTGHSLNVSMEQDATEPHFRGWDGYQAEVAWEAAFLTERPAETFLVHVTRDPLRSVQAILSGDVMYWWDRNRDLYRLTDPDELIRVDGACRMVEDATANITAMVPDDVYRLESDDAGLKTQCAQACDLVGVPRPSEEDFDLMVRFTNRSRKVRRYDHLTYDDMTPGVQQIARDQGYLN